MLWRIAGSSSKSPIGGKGFTFQAPKSDEEIPQSVSDLNLGELDIGLSPSFPELPKIPSVINSEEDDEDLESIFNN
jgi:hypothetical protein